MCYQKSSDNYYNAQNLYPERIAIIRDNPKSGSEELKGLKNGEWLANVIAMFHFIPRASSISSRNISFMIAYSETCIGFILEGKLFYG